MRLGEIADRFPGVPRIALTATAAPATQKDIAKRLGLEEAPWFCSSFDRSNIRYEIVEKTSRRTQLLSFLDRHRGSTGIVYCGSRKRVDENTVRTSGRGRGGQTL